MFFCCLQRTTKNDKNVPPNKDARAKHCFADQSYLIQLFILHYYGTFTHVVLQVVFLSFLLKVEVRLRCFNISQRRCSECMCWQVLQFSPLNLSSLLYFFTILWSGFANTVTLHWEADDLKRLLVCIHPSCLRVFVSSTPNEWSKALSCLSSLELYVVFLKATCGQPCQFHLRLLSHRTGQIFRPVEGVDRTLSSNGTVQYFHSNYTEMMNQVEFELFQGTLPSAYAQCATLANPSCIHATTPFVHKRPVKFSMVKAQSLTSILAFEFLNS